MPRLLRDDQRDILAGFYLERFGIPREIFADFEMFAFSRQAFLFRRQPIEIKWPERAFVRCGLPFVRNVAGFLKPTTVFIQRFGKEARRNVLELDLETIASLCQGGEIELPSLFNRVDVPGYIIVKFKEHHIGTALALEGNRLLCRFPKAMRQALSRLTPR